MQEQRFGTEEVFCRKKKDGIRFDPDEPVIVNMELRTHAARPLSLPAETGLFRFYDLNPNNKIKGLELMNLINDNQIQINGQLENESWMWATQKNLTTGIFVKINANQRMWVPPHPNNEPILVPENGTHYRQIIDELLEPVPLDGKNRLWIGETPKLTLPAGIHAVLAPNTFRFKHNGNIEKGYHIKSRLIDADSNWPIRVEVISPSDGHEEWVLFYFFRNPTISLE